METTHSEAPATAANPAVSVIVPVYKAEKYLHKCVDSLLAQTFQDFELLLIDDGSPDGSGAICDEYAQKDSRVRVFHKSNGGVSSARQYGLDQARGEYTIHADPDDWVEPGMLEALYGKAKSEGADMVICDFYVNDRCGQRYVAQRPTALDHESVLCDLFQRLHGSLWNKLVRRACYKEYGVRFPKDLNVCEDKLINLQLMRYPLKISYLPEAYYHYDQQVNPNSIVRHMLSNHLQQDERIIALARESFPEESFRRDRNALICNALFHIFCISSDTSSQFHKKYSKYRSDILHANYSKWKRGLLLLSLFGLYTPLKTLYNGAVCLKNI